MLNVVHVSKSFDGTAALRDVSVRAEAGQVLAICGENGAGKTTLMKILSGAIKPDEGEILLNDVNVAVGNPRRAIELGIHTVHQELSLLPHLSVAENILLGKWLHRKTNWIVDWKATEQRAAEVIRDFGFEGVDVSSRVSKLSISKQQLVEIAKALVGRPKILILDEPSAVLSVHETQKLFRKIRELSASGTLVVYISHRLDEIFDISDNVFVLKDGAGVLFSATASVDRDTVIKAMVGRSLDAIYPVRQPRMGEVALDIRHLSRRPAFDDISFTIRAGEIVGMFGLVGSGRTEVARAIFGAEPASTGEILVSDEKVLIATPADAIASGIAFVTEDRKRDGLALDCSVVENGGLAAMERFAAYGVLNLARRSSVVGTKLDELQVRPRGLSRPVRQLSGGNQQKVVLAKWMLVEDTRVFIFDEPTRGVDIATKVQIYRILENLAKAGQAILLISSEMPEVLGLCDRLIIMRGGRIAVVLDRDDFSMETVFAHAAGIVADRTMA
ncbi:MAG TPA: sugar ABC transporter ATP-binding protein [Aestuariivirgaceae bacterium]|nr:sugar ABC transporter ATP-binding protein [Aestuariivirgaceae bacterium]